jgi:hypothetical protein
LIGTTGNGFAVETLIYGVAGIENVTAAFKDGPYEFECDNDVVDGRTQAATFTMVAFTSLICDGQQLGPRRNNWQYEQVVRGNELLAREVKIE